MSCPLGYICLPGDPETRTSCLELQKIAIDVLQAGNIHDGIYCPEGQDVIQNCKLGYYCPDPSTMLPCPSGYYCPHKTQNPEIKCSSCPEGSQHFKPELWGYFVVIPMIVLLVALLFQNKLRKQKQMIESHIAKLAGSASTREEKILKKRQAELNRFRSQLEAIQKKLNQDAIIKEDENGLLVFDAELLFDMIDVDKSGNLDYGELNRVLDLKQGQIFAFIDHMNTLAGLPLGEKSVSKKPFVMFFFRTLEYAMHFDPSDDEAERMYYEILEDLGLDKNDEIDINRLYQTRLSDFLTDVQINLLKKKFIIIKNVVSSSPAGNVTDEGNDETTSRRLKEIPRSRSRRKSITFSSFVVPSIHVSMELFCSFYAIFLREVKKIAFDDSSTASEVIDLAFENLSLSVNAQGKEKFVVDNVTGYVKGTCMTAIMGASGSGKTSLLNALCGRAFYGNVTGKIYINGQRASIDENKSMVGFVPQHDIVYPELTVRENLYFAGKLKLPSGTSKDEIKELTEETMAKLGLTRVADSLVGSVSVRGISGGEKKRVNIGLELMSHPRILFLDEPTSGLDSNSAIIVMKSLKALAKRSSMTICSVIHQPRRQIFNLFDSVLLLGVGGKTMYCGPLNEIVDYFSKLRYVLPVGENVADWLLDISTGSIDPVEHESDSVRSTNLQTGKVFDVFIAGQLTRVAQKKLANSLNLFQQWERSQSEALSVHESFASSLTLRELPISQSKPHFFHQLVANIHRNLIILTRQMYSKVLTTFTLIVIFIIICVLDGNTKLTTEIQPGISNEYLVLTSDDPGTIRLSFFLLFRHALECFLVPQFAMKIAVIGGVVLGLEASRGFTGRTLEFFREASSGYDVNAYYIALHITTLLQQFTTVFMAALTVLWLRNTSSSEIHFVLNFLMFDWVVVAWALLFPLFIPPNNVVAVLGTFSIFFGMQFSGMVDPMRFRDLYDTDYLGIITGIMSISRYFVEGMAVSEQRALPPQSGFTFKPINTTMYGSNSTGFFYVGQALHDLDHAATQSFAGWYWPFLRQFMVGLTIRILSLGILHVSNRPKQCKKNLIITLREIKTPKKCILPLIWIAAFGVSLYFTVHFILN